MLMKIIIYIFYEKKILFFSVRFDSSAVMESSVIIYSFKFVSSLFRILIEATNQSTDIMFLLKLTAWEVHCRMVLVQDQDMYVQVISFAFAFAFESVFLSGLNY